jgi:hypothetical protein
MSSKTMIRPRMGRSKPSSKRPSSAKKTSNRNVSRPLKAPSRAPSRARIPSRKNAAAKPSKQQIQPEKEDVADVSELPAVIAKGTRIGNYAVVSPKKDIGKLGKFAVLAWTPEEYNYESGNMNIPQLFIFHTKRERDNWQEDLYDDVPSLWLQAYEFDIPVLMRSSAPMDRR